MCEYNWGFAVFTFFALVPFLTLCTGFTLITFGTIFDFYDLWGAINDVAFFITGLRSDSESYAVIVCVANSGYFWCKTVFAVGSGSPLSTPFSLVTFFTFFTTFTFITLWALSSGVTFVAFWSLSAGVTFFTLWALGSGVTFFTLWALGSGVSLVTFQSVLDFHGLWFAVNDIALFITNLRSDGEGYAVIVCVANSGYFWCQAVFTVSDRG